MQITKNFSLEELCETSRHIPNRPSLHEQENLTKLCVNVLQPLRDHIGKSITVNSGYRNPILNHLVKGANNSDHIFGYAADITVGNKDGNKKMYEWIRDNCKFRQLINETSNGSNWIHVSYNESDNKKQLLIFDGKKYIPGK